MANEGMANEGMANEGMANEDMANEGMANEDTEDTKDTEITKEVKTLDITGDLRLNGQFSATTFGNITLGNDGKICIGNDTCLDKPTLNKLIELSKKN